MNLSEESWANKNETEWVKKYEVSATASYRHAVTTALDSVRPLRTLLDIGCNCGTLMPAILASEPTVRVYGIDINHIAIKAAKQQWKYHTWLCGSANDWLPVWAEEDWWFDAVTSSSCLSCIPPDVIDGVLRGIVRITNTLVIQDVTTTSRIGEGSAGLYGMDEWYYDYRTRLGALDWVDVHREWQQVDTNRPAAVMIFRPRGTI